MEHYTNQEIKVIKEMAKNRGESWVLKLSIDLHLSSRVVTELLGSLEGKGDVAGPAEEGMGKAPALRLYRLTDPGMTCERLLLQRRENDAVRKTLSATEYLIGDAKLALWGLCTIQRKGEEEA